MAVSNVSTVDTDTWQLIATNTPSAASSSTFSSISGYKTLIVVWKLTHAASDYTRVVLNSETTGNNYGGTCFQGSTYTNNVNEIRVQTPADTLNTGILFIENADKTIPKVFRSVSSGGQGSGTYITASAVTSIAVSCINGNTTSGTIYLYGIAA